MNVHFLTPFPKMVDSIIGESILGRAQSKGYVNYNIHNLFDYADEPHCRIDDYPFGGGDGMLLKPEPIFKAVEQVKKKSDKKPIKVIFPTPDGVLFNHDMAKELSNESTLIFICGHYKGIDQRIRDEIITDEISIGDFVLTNGELPTMIMIDSIVRLKKGVLNNYGSATKDSFYNILLDGPHYTRPRNFNGMKVPDVLLSGNHKEIRDWFLNEQKIKTKKLRKDLWGKYKSCKESGV